MKTLTILFLAGAVAAAPGGAIASSQTAQDEQQASESTQAKQHLASKDQKKVCRKLKVSGTRFAEKVCMTKAEWEKVDAETKA